MTTLAPPQKLFFVTGPAKSGTTWLQALLNLHPQISCGEEQDLKRLIEVLQKAVTEYNLRAVTLDLRTGGTGRPAFDNQGLQQLVRAAALTIAQARSAGRPLAGFKDNRLFRRLDAIGRIFPEARFLCIVRNPLDRAVSAWHHNLHLAEREDDPRHRELMLRHGDLEGWAANVVRMHRADMAAFWATKARDRRLLLRYEDLVADPMPQLQSALAFLGAETSEATLSAMLQGASLEALRASSALPAFFRAGTIRGGAGELSEAFRLEMGERFAQDFARLGYRVTREGLEVLPFDQA